MKKLVFGMAAIAAGTVLADVTSANIVGYSNRELTKAFQELSSGDFVGVASQEFTLDELKMNEEEPDGGTTLRWLLPDGSYQKVYWNYLTEGGEYIELPDGSFAIGWGDADGVQQHYIFKAGEGFFMTPSEYNEEPRLLSSGALYTWPFLQKCG